MLWLVFAVVVGASPVKRDVPGYVKDYAAQLVHTTPKVNYTTVDAPPLTLNNLDVLNQLGGNAVYLTSNEGLQALPSWFNGVAPQGGSVGSIKSSAVVTVEKPSVGDGVVDAFYFYFYAYNQGNDVNILGRDLGYFGNHVGDWEHSMVRFQNGIPQAVWLSQHSAGEAFTYDALEKDNLRPVVYIGNGTHATWATPGPHEHTIPGFSLPFKGFLTDQTDEGPLYDSILSSYFYSYDGTTFTSYGSDPVNWLYFQGQWGDQQLPDDAKGQVNLFGQRKYSSGPNGPLFKDLMRSNVCPSSVKPCIVRPFTTA